VFEFVGELALGGGRLAWIEGGGGNSLELSLYAAPLTGGPTSAKNLDFAANGNGAGENIAGGYIGQLLGSGALLAYNSWTRCSNPENVEEPSAACPEYGFVSAQKLRRIGAGKPTQILTGPSAWQLVAVGGGRLGLLSEGATKAAGDSLAIRSPSGVLTGTIPARPGEAIRAVALSADALVLQRKQTLDVHSPATGSILASYPLGPDTALQLAGTGGGLALLRGRHRLRLVRLRDGKRITLPLAAGTRSCACPVDAKLTERGLFYAYNTPTTSARGRIVFWPTSELAGRF
jgi:hypothetical protein